MKLKRLVSAILAVGMALTMLPTAAFAADTPKYVTDLDFEANGQSYKNSYVLFENDYEISHDTELRRASAASFYQTLRAYKNTTASAYLAQVKNEQIQAKLRGFNSTIDYLLFQQNILSLA